MQMDRQLYLVLHAQALDDVERLLAGVDETQLERPSTCPPWDLRALLGHMIGQNAGFAAAVESGTAPLSAFAEPSVESATLTAAWHESAARLRSAFAAADPSRPVILADIDPERPIPGDAVLAMQLLDTAVHAWDVAASLGRHYRPDDETVRAVADIATLVPVGPERDERATFAPPVEPAVPEDDPWRAALEYLGRDPR